VTEISDYISCNLLFFQYFIFSALLLVHCKHDAYVISKCNTRYFSAWLQEVTHLFSSVMHH